MARWGGIDDLVNNAGTWDHGALLELSTDRWRKVFEVNLMAPIAIAKAAVPHMKRGGSIVNVSSVLASGRTWTGPLLCFEKCPDRSDEDTGR